MVDTLGPAVTVAAYKKESTALLARRVSGNFVIIFVKMCIKVQPFLLDTLRPFAHFLKKCAKAYPRVIKIIKNEVRVSCLNAINARLLRAVA